MEVWIIESTIGAIVFCFENSLLSVSTKWWLNIDFWFDIDIHIRNIVVGIICMLV